MARAAAASLAAATFCAAAARAFAVANCAWACTAACAAASACARACRAASSLDNAQQIKGVTTDKDACTKEHKVYAYQVEFTMAKDTGETLSYRHSFFGQIITQRNAYNYLVPDRRSCNVV